MLEREFPKLEIIGDEPDRRDYCIVPDQDTINKLDSLLLLEDQLAEGSLVGKKEQGAILAHTLIWSQLSDEYKSELADLEAIVLF